MKTTKKNRKRQIRLSRKNEINHLPFWKVTLVLCHQVCLFWDLFTFPTFLLLSTRRLWRNCEWRSNFSKELVEFKFLKLEISLVPVALMWEMDCAGRTFLAFFCCRYLFLFINSIIVRHVLVGWRPIWILDTSFFFNGFTNVFT